MTCDIVVGSIADVAEKKGASIAESFMNCDAMVIIDVSGSMGMTDSRGGLSRYEVALEELAKLQASMPGKVAVVAFSDGAQFVPGGVPMMLGGGTDLAGALRFARIVDGTGMRFVVVSDGEPDDESAAMTEAQMFEARIDTVYVGPERYPAGRSFLQRLAAASGGQSVTADRAQELAAQVETLLLHA
ncbi:MAG: VWA domain-containing protein [Chloroflexi bacterium]|nr:VWA domain-containing protein [Chloroflexota bacterium]